MDLSLAAVMMLGRTRLFEVPLAIATIAFSIVIGLSGSVAAQEDPPPTLDPLLEGEVFEYTYTWEVLIPSANDLLLLSRTVEANLEAVSNTSTTISYAGTLTERTRAPCFSSDDNPPCDGPYVDSENTYDATAELLSLQMSSDGSYYRRVRLNADGQSYLIEGDDPCGQISGVSTRRVSPSGRLQEQGEGVCDNQKNVFSISINAGGADKLCDQPEGEKGKKLSDPISLARGDHRLGQTDLVIPGRGMDFQFSRKYLSRSGLWSAHARVRLPEDWSSGTPGQTRLSDLVGTQPLGMNWDHNWNKFVQKEVPTLTNGGIALHDGDGRREEFSYDSTLQLFTRNQHHSVLEYDSDDTSVTYGVVKKLDADGTEWVFNSLTGTVNPGYLDRVTDRNGNTITVAYKSATDNRIATITDTLQRVITFAYHDDPAAPLYDATVMAGDPQPHAHLLWKVTDFAGRGVEFAYNVDQGVYSRDELASVALPEIKNTLEFSLGSEHERFSGTNRRMWRFTYHAEEVAVGSPTNGNNPAGDGVIAWWSGQLHQVWSPNDDVIVENQYSKPTWQFTHNDYRVREQAHGGGSYTYAVADSDGDRIPDAPVDATELNFDPGNYTVWVADRRGYATRLDYYGYADEISSFARALRLHRKIEYTSIVTPDGTSQWWSGLNDPDGTPPNPPFVEGVDGYLATYEYNADWRRTTRSDPGSISTNTIGYYRDEVASDDPRKGGAITSHTRVNDSNTNDTLDEQWRYDFAFGAGGCSGCGGGGGFATAYEDPSGTVTFYDYDADGNRLSVFHDTDMGIDDYSNGTVLVGTDTPTDRAKAVETFTYNSHGQPLTHTHAEHSTGPLVGDTHTRLDRFVWDETTGDSTYGYLLSRTVDDNGFALTTSYEYDAVGNRTAVVESDSDRTELVFNQANQLVHRISKNPAGHILAQAKFFYDANGNLIREDVWNVRVDSTGQSFILDSNEWITTLHEYDELDFPVRTAREIGGFDETTLTDTGTPSRAYDVATITSGTDGSTATSELRTWAVTEYEYDNNQNLTVVRHPEAVNGNQLANTQVMVYDERDLLVASYGGAPETAFPVPDSTPAESYFQFQHFVIPQITGYTRDEKGRVTSTFNGFDATTEQETLHHYDAFNRKIASQDPMGNWTYQEYDDNGNVIRMAACGARNTDTATDLENALLSYAKVVYDRRDRAVERRTAIFNSAPGLGTDVPCHATFNGTEVVWSAGDPASVDWQIEVTTYNDNDSVRFTAAQAGASPSTTLAWSPSLSVDQMLTNFQNDAGVAVTESFYDTASRLRQVVDEFANTVDYFYDEGSNLGVVAGTDVRSGGSEIYVTAYEYDGLDRQVASTDGVYAGLSAFVDDAYTTPVDLLDAFEDDTVGGPENLSTSEYDSRGNHIATIDPQLNRTEHTYDGLSRLTQTMVVDSGLGDAFAPEGMATGTADDNLVTSIAYDTSSRVIARTDDSGNATRYFYDGADRELLMRMADGSIHQTGTGFTGVWADGAEAPSSFGGFFPGYDILGNSVLMTDARRVIQSLEYDDNNRLTKRTISATGLSSEASLFFGGAMLEEFTYDGLGRIRTADNYDDTGGSTPIAEIERFYDSRSLLTRETVTVRGGDDRSVDHTYNVAGMDVSCVYPGTGQGMNRRTINKTHDTLNRLSAIDESAGGAIAAYTYVGPARTHERTLGTGAGARTSTFTYSGFQGDDGTLADGDLGVGLIRSITHGSSGAVTAFDFRWDASGNKVDHRQIKPQGSSSDHRSRRLRSFEYDEANRLIESTYTYGDPVAAAGVVPSLFTSGGTMQYTLDGVHNRHAVTVDAGTQPPSVGYEALSGLASNPYGESDLDTTVYRLDRDNQNDDFDYTMGNELNQYGSTPRSYQHEYDTNGNMTLAGQTPQVADLNGDGVADADDFLEMLVAFGSTCTVSSTEPCDTSCDGIVTPQDPSYDYLFDGSPYSAADRGDYGCTGSGAATIMTPDVDYDNDGIADRVCRVAGDTDGDCDADADDFIAVLVGFGKDIDRTTYIYDWRNQLVSLTASDASEDTTYIGDYDYDAFNRRVRVTESSDDGVTTSKSVGDFVYGGQANWQLLAEYSVTLDGSGNPTSVSTLTSEYVYGNYIDEIVQARRDGNGNGILGEAGDETHYYFQDDLFSVYAITDDGGTVVERYEYGDYGSPLVLTATGYDVRDVGGMVDDGTGGQVYSDTGTGDGVLDPEELDTPIRSALDNRHTFTGRLYDSATGLMQYRHRYMMPKLGRFTQRDPLEFFDSMNVFTYVLSNPGLFVDPFGEQCMSCTMASGPTKPLFPGTKTLPCPEGIPRPRDCQDLLVCADCFEYGECMANFFTVCHNRDTLNPDVNPGVMNRFIWSSIKREAAECCRKGKSHLNCVQHVLDHKADLHERCVLKCLDNNLWSSCKSVCGFKVGNFNLVSFAKCMLSGKSVKTCLARLVGRAPKPRACAACVSAVYLGCVLGCS